jgi:hypothetical protein
MSPLNLEALCGHTARTAQGCPWRVAGAAVAVARVGSGQKAMCATM